MPDYRLNFVLPKGMADGGHDKLRTGLRFASRVLAHRASGADEAIGTPAG